MCRHRAGGSGRALVAGGLFAVLAGCGGAERDGGARADGGPPGAGSGADAPAPPLPALEPPCGTGTWRPGALEIHHLAIGQADATLVVSPTGRTLLVDVGETHFRDDKGAVAVGAYVERVLGSGCRRLDHVVVTHFHLDHIGYVGEGGLWHLVTQQRFSVGKLLHREAERFLGDTSGTYRLWRQFLAGDGRELLRPEAARPGRWQIDLGPEVEARVVALDGDGQLRAGDFSMDRSPPNENDYSIVLLLRMGRFDYLVAGDLTGETAPGDFGYTYHDVETRVARKLPDVDVYRVSHHGSHHSSNPTFLAQIDPEVSIISCGDGNSYGHPRQATVDRLLATGALYLTQRGEPRTNLRTAKVGGAIVVRTRDGVTYTVNDDPFTATDPARVDGDGDGYFREADPDDANATALPPLNGGCGPVYQACSP